MYICVRNVLFICLQSNVDECCACLCGLVGIISVCLPKKKSTETFTLKLQKDALSALDKDKEV